MRERETDCERDRIDVRERVDTSKRERERDW